MSDHKFTGDRSDMAHQIKREMISKPQVKITPKVWVSDEEDSYEREDGYPHCVGPDKEKPRGA